MSGRSHPWHTQDRQSRSNLPNRVQAERVPRRSLTKDAVSFIAHECAENTEVGVNNSIVSLPFATAILIVNCAASGWSAEPFRLENLVRPATVKRSTTVPQSANVQLAQYEHSNGKPALQLRPPRSQAAGSTYSIQRSAQDYMRGGTNPAPVQSSQPPVTNQQPIGSPSPTVQANAQSVQHPMLSNQVSSTPARVIQKGASAVRGMFRREPEQATPQQFPDPTHLAFDSGPVTPDLHISAARMMVQKGEIAAAFQHYQSALRIDPRCRHALIGLARLQHRGGDLAGAIKTYQVALQRLGKDAVVCNDLGLCLARAGRHEEATQMLRTALSINPNSKMYRNNLAATYVDARRPNEALQVLGQAYGDTIAQYNVGYLLQQRGALDEAREYFIRALRSDPAFTPARQMLDSLEIRMSNRPAERVPQPRRDYSLNDGDRNEHRTPSSQTTAASLRKTPPVALATATEPVTNEIATGSAEPARMEPERLSSFLPAEPQQPLGLEDTVEPTISFPEVFRLRNAGDSEDALIAPLPLGFSFE